jgi:heptosyltransferase-2
MFHIIGSIRKRRFDLAILFQNAFEAALLAYLGGVPMRIGYSREGRGFLLTHKIKTTEAISKKHQSEYYLSILTSMGWKGESSKPILYVGQSNLAMAEDLMRTYDIGPKDFVIAMSPGAIFGKAKQWPHDRFAKIGDWAVERWGAKVIVMGSHRETDLCESLRRIMKHKSVNVSGKTTLGEAMGVISRCQLFVTNDSGLMHIAAALNVPTVAIFGSTDPSATGPQGLRTRIVRHEIDCSPCFRSECKRDYQCMLSIEPEEVWKAMEHFHGAKE